MGDPEQALALDPVNITEEDEETFEMTPRSEPDGQVPTGVGVVRRNEYLRKRANCCGQQCLWFILGILIAFSFILLSSIIIIQFPAPKVCTTSTCEQAFVRVLSLLDQQVNPCENFYAFACGKRTGDYGDQAGFMQQGQSNIQNIITELIEDPEGTTESVAVNQARKLYYHCLSNSFLPSNEEDMKLLTDTVIPEMGASLEQILAKLFVYNVQATIFQINVAQDESGSVFLKFSSPNIRNVYVSENEARKKYHNEILRSLLPGLTTEEADEIIDFDTQLSQLSIKSSKLQISQFQIWSLEEDEKISLGKMAQRYPQVNWIQLLEHICEDLGWKITISSDVEIALSHPTYFEDIATLIDKSKIRTVKNYIAWNFIRSFQPFLGKSYVEKLISLEQYPNRVSEDTIAINGRHHCTQMVKDEFEHALGYLYSKRNPIDGKKKIVNEMFCHIKEEFLKAIGNEEWIPKGMEDFQNNLRTKATKIQIGYPEYYNNATAVDGEDAEMQLNNRSFILNLLSLKKFRLSQVLMNLNMPMVEREQWAGSGLELNAYHFPGRNEIFIPQVSLSSPVFDENYPMYWNFASLGTLIAHELVHGFDSSCRHYDHSGNLTYWWPKEVEMPFRNQASCLVRMFDDFKLPGNGSLNGKITLAENIADSAMLKLAFKGYQEWAKEREITELPLPGLDFTIQEIFHIIYSQTYCEDLDSSVYNDYNFYTHSPAEHRVTAIIQNDEDFGKLFNCPVGSPMNPADKCTIWA